MQAAAAAYDQALLDCHRDVAMLDLLSPTEALQCQLPLRLGGRGLRGQARLAPAAWLASWAQCLSEIVHRTNLEELTDLDSCELPVAGHCRAALSTLPPPLASERDEGGSDPLDWQDWVRQPRAKLQKRLSKRLDEKTYANLLTLLDAPARARLRSVSGPLASAWQWATPCHAGERIDDDVYRTTARALLGQPVVPSASSCQNRTRTGPHAGEVCGVPLCPRGHHCHRCARGGGLKARSEDVEKELACIHRECGHAVDTQVYVPAWNRWRTFCAPCALRSTTWDNPDAPCSSCGGQMVAELEEATLVVEFRSARILRAFIDVTVRHSIPSDAARLAAAARGGGAVNREAEADKKRRYPDGRAPWDVIPFALETYGRLGSAALSHLRSLARTRAQEAGAESVEYASVLLLKWSARISAALQRSNARRLRSALGAVKPARRRARELAESLAG